MARTAIIIGGGPAGLTAAFELLERTNIKPIVLERSEYMGGISRTVDYKGNKIDIGGHRFFTKSDRVMNWWLKMLPSEETVDPETEDLVMLIRHRKSRILFAKHLFDYPISLSYRTLKQLGLRRTFKILLSFLRISLFPIKDEKNLADFFTNRFGRELYLTFFKSYTEKVWGIPCEEISPEWGDQSVKGLSIWTAVAAAYARFGEVREYLDKIGNLYLVGRNGMHKYNNMDHSMLTAMVAVDNIISGVTDKTNIWAVNTEHEYIEDKQ